jgi:hypothetical protein
MYLSFDRDRDRDLVRFTGERDRDERFTLLSIGVLVTVGGATEDKVAIKI